MDLKALYRIGYGLYAVGSRSDSKLNAQIANTVFQVTSEPPTIAVSINRKNLTHEFISQSKVFTASMLVQETPLPFVGRLGFKSGHDGDKLAGVSYREGVTKAPVVVENAAACVEARLISHLDVNTHTIFVGEIVAAEVLNDKPTMTYEYYQQVKRGTTPKTAPSYIPPEKKEPPVVMPKYKCTVCGYVYDPEKGDPDGGIKPGTPFEALPDTWECPVCGARKSEFEKI